MHHSPGKYNCTLASELVARIEQSGIGNQKPKLMGQVIGALDLFGKTDLSSFSCLQIKDD